MITIKKTLLRTQVAKEMNSFKEQSRITNISLLDLIDHARDKFLFIDIENESHLSEIDTISLLLPIADAVKFPNEYERTKSPIMRSDATSDAPANLEKYYLRTDKTVSVEDRATFEYL